MSKANLREVDKSKFYFTDQEFHLQIVKKCNSKKLQVIFFSEIYDLIRLCQHMYVENSEKFKGGDKKSQKSKYLKNLKEEE